MSFMKNLIADHKEEIINKIFDDEMQEKIVNKLNENIDIPIISEKTEAKILKAIKGLAVTQANPPTKQEFVAHAVDNYFDELVKKKFIK